jgi:Fur family peroxide stress response transcriptional regulator
VTDIDIRFNEMIAALKGQDFRLTPQRVELVRLIAASNGHPNAAQLYEEICKHFPTMSQATVYKTLGLLKDLGQVFEIDLHGDSHYDGNRPQPHSHLICMKCNKIIDGDVDIDMSAIQKLEKQSGYKIVRSMISFYGLCPNCQ